MPFAQIAHTVLYDARLSWKAKGLFGYLYSKPEGYDFSYDRIKRDGSDGKFTVLQGLKELEKFGYLWRKKQGTGRVNYVIVYDPGVENRHQDTDPDAKNWNQDVDPGAENRKLQKPQVAKTGTISNRDNINNNDIENNKESDFPFLRNIEFREAYRSFVEMRTKKKRPTTERAARMILKKLHEYPLMESIMMLDKSTLNGWQGVFELKPDEKPRKPVELARADSIPESTPTERARGLAILRRAKDLALSKTMPV